MVILEQTPQEVSRPILKPGKYYVLVGKERGMDLVIDPALYVRDEKIDEGKWHVFAAADKQGLLLRARIPIGYFSPSSDGKTIHSRGMLETRAICSDRKDDMRAKDVSSFIDDTYNLIRYRGAYDFEHAVRELIRDPNDSRVRLKLVIDLAYKRDHKPQNYLLA